MGEIGILVDLLLFYTVERALFNKLVLILGKNSREAKSTIAVWLLLEENGYHDLMRTIHSQNNKTIEALFNESLHSLEYIKANATEATVQLHDTPVLQGLSGETMSNYSRDFMYKRYKHIMETVCNKIFGEKATIEVDESGTRPVARPFGHGVLAATRATDVSRDGEADIEAARESNLNPEAYEFFPGKAQEDARTMFLTFSKGHPLTCKEINLFTLNWGEVVQDVFIESTRPGQDPQFGRIVFTTSTVIPRVLNGQSTAKFLVNRKHLWARIYMNRQGGKKITS